MQSLLIYSPDGTVLNKQTVVSHYSADGVEKLTQTSSFYY